MNSVGTLTAEYHSCVTFECKTAMTTPADIKEEQRENMENGNIQHTFKKALITNDTMEHNREHSQMGNSPSSSTGGTSPASSPALPLDATNAISTEMNQVEGEEISSLEDSDPATSDAHSSHGDNEMLLPHLHNGLLSMKMNMPTYNSPCGEDGRLATLNDKRNGFSFPPMLDQSDILNEVYRCHLCNFTETSKFHFNSHMDTHFDHKCPFCDYTSRTEGRLKRHVNDFHSETPPDSWAGTRVPHVGSNANGTDEGSGEIVSEENGSSGGNDTTPPGKARQYRCKQCSFVAVSKTAFWEHSKTHIKAEKLLTCPKCPFVTEYKHHLEYHLRNHFGSKPFKCAKCNYSCVNKSMLNSHMKSHSNVYQYRCSECSYATKYCHSLKLHLRKYSHKPASVLNVDGSPNPYPVIDVYGTRRGPRQKKGKNINSITQSENGNGVVGQHPTPTVNYPHNISLPPLIPSTLGMPFLYPPHLLNGFHGNMFVRPPVPPLPPPPAIEYQEMECRPSDNTVPTNDNGSGSTTQPKFGPLKCRLCDFSTELRELFSKHMLLHAASENQDLCKLYGINSDTLLHEQTVSNNKSVPPNQRNYRNCGNSTSYGFGFESEQHSRNHNTSDSNSDLPKALNCNSHINGADVLPHKNIYNQQTEATKESPALPVLVGGMAVPFSTCSTTVSSSINQQSVLHQQLSSNTVKNEHKTSQGVIVSHRSPSQNVINIHSYTVSRSPVLSKNEHANSEASDQRPETSSPLDLTSYKSTNTNAISNLSELTKSCVVTELPKDANTTTLNNKITSSAPTQSRNRRKGKAFKLDRFYLKLQENHSPNDEFSNTDSNPLVENTFEHLDEQVEEIENELPHKHEEDNTKLPIVTFPDEHQQRVSPVLQSKSHNHYITSKPSQMKPLEMSGSKQTFFPLTSSLQFQIPHFSGLNGITETHKSNAIMYHGRSSYHHPTTSSMRMPCMSTGDPRFQFQPTISTQDSVQKHSMPKSHAQENKLETTQAEKKSSEEWEDTFACEHCDMAFRDCIMYTMHMGYHGFGDPFTCNMCGEQCMDKLSFFLHIARTAHL